MPSQEETPQKRHLPRSVELAQTLRTSKDFANTMGAIMADVLSGEITPQMANAACNAGGKLLKVVDMEQRYGTKEDGAPDRTMRLTTDTRRVLPERQ